MAIITIIIDNNVAKRTLSARQHQGRVARRVMGRLLRRFGLGVGGSGVSG